MQTFQYLAVNRDGKRIKGTLVSENKTAAYGSLRAQGLFPTEVNTVDALGGKPGRGRRRAQLRAEDRTILTRQFAVLLRASLSKEDALDAILSSRASAATHLFAGRVKSQVMQGQDLADAFQSAGGGFERYYIAALRAGEDSGRMPEVFERLADHLETRGTNEAKILSALIYPGFVALVSVLVCGIMVTQIAPELEGMFTAAGQPLPAITRSMLSLTGGLRANLLPIGLILAGLALAAWLLSRRPGIRLRWETAVLRLPLFGRLAALSLAAGYLRTLAVVLRSRQTIAVATRSAAEVLTWLGPRQQAEQVVIQVERGKSLAQALSALDFLPAIALQMIRVGEETADVATMSDRTAEVIETWLETDRRRLITLLEPMLMMVVGAVVLVVVLSMLLPIFDLQSTISL